MNKYRKKQKLREKEITKLTGFHPNVGKTFVVFPSSAWKVLRKTIALVKCCPKYYCSFQNSTTFYLRNCHRLRYAVVTYIVPLQKPFFCRSVLAWKKSSAFHLSGHSVIMMKHVQKCTIAT